MGFTLNVVTLLSLSLVVGMLVDDAIVEIENIMRHLRMGKTPYQAAMEAADEIGLAVIATTFTLIAVFLPTAFMSGVAGKFFVQFGWTAAIAVFFSLVVARMLTPMMAAYILKPVADEHAPPRWLRVYEGWAAWCLQHRLLTMLAATIFFVGSFMLVQTRYILAEYVELDVHACAHLDVAEVGVVVSVGDDSHGERVFCRVAHGERNAVHRYRSLVYCEVATLRHLAVELVLEGVVCRSVGVAHLLAHSSAVHMSLHDMTVQSAVHQHRALHVHAVAHL
jgi:hypothetical protein